MGQNYAEAQSRTYLKISKKVNKKSKYFEETIVIVVVIICLGLVILELLTNIHNKLNF